MARKTKLVVVNTETPDDGKIIAQEWGGLVPIADLRLHGENAREGDVGAIYQSIAAVKFYGALLVQRSTNTVIVGNHRLKAAHEHGIEALPVIWLDVDDQTARKILVGDNRHADLASWNQIGLAELLQSIQADTGTLLGTGFDQESLANLLHDLATPGFGQPIEDEDEAPEPPVEPVSRLGDLWLCGRHRVFCGDCRDAGAVARLFEDRKANAVVTSPPYATQREYDPASGFKPIRPEEYIEWYRDVAANIQAVLAEDGSYFLNIKEHAEDGQRHLYVKKLVIAHVEEWGWRFVDEFCWRKTNEGVPGGWNNRFKNAWEPIFHFCRQASIKFRPEAVSHASEDCFDYSPNNPKSASGSGLLGSGARGSSAGKLGTTDEDGGRRGLARPSNVIEAKTESNQGSHSAPFPTAIPEFFIRAFSDAGDVIFDPFLGSGTTMVAATLLDRIEFGLDISPAYCDVSVLRWQKMTGEQATLEGDGRTFDQIAVERTEDRRTCQQLAGRPSRCGRAEERRLISEAIPGPATRHRPRQGPRWASQAEAG